MSFVFCIGGSNFSIMMGDGRLMKYPEEAVVSETIRKVHKLNDNVLLGATGDPDPMWYLLNKTSKLDLSTKYIEDLEEIITTLLKPYKTNFLGTHLILSGRNSEGRFATCTMDSKNNYKGEWIRHSGNGIIKAMSGIDQKFCETVTNYYFENKQFRTLEEIEYSMLQCMREIALQDKTVNMKVFKEVII